MKGAADMPDRRRPANRKKGGNTAYYIDGNTVRKVQPEPYLPTEEELRIRRKQAAKRRLRQREKAKRQAAARKNQEKAQRLDLGYTLFLMFSALLTVAACVIYLNTQSALTRQNSVISSLESELSTLENENAAARERLNSAVDLSEVYQKAINEYGMTAITEDQIHYYSSDNQDYIKQYQEIPSDK